MYSTFKSNDTNISEIIRGIDSGSIQLPDFQRGWVWDDSRIKALILSIMNGYPVGALMFLEYGGDSVRFKYRTFTGCDKDCRPDTLVLDGQQRLTSIFTALYCKNPVHTRDEKGKELKRFYYLKIRECLDGGAEDNEDAILSIPEDRQLRTNFGRNVEFDISSEQFEYKELAFPLNKMFSTEEWLTWTTNCMEYYNHDQRMVQLLNRFQTGVLVPMQNYQVPVITLSKETPKEAVCQVFENVNTGGVSLTVFELVTATFAADDYDLRSDWEGSEKEGAEGRHERMKDASSILEGVSATDFLTALTLLVRYNESMRKDGRAVSCKKKDVLALQLEDYMRYADVLEQGFVEASHFLKQQRIFASRDLPYTTQLIPLSVLLALLGPRAKDSTVRTRIAQWYWCGVLGEMYGGANETRYVNDVTGMMQWLDNPEEMPDTIQRAYFQPTRLVTLQTRLSAAYKGIMALILKHGAVDFISGVPMDFTNFTDQAVDIHHVFPKDYCEKQGFDKRRWNSIVNKTPLSASTNRIIGGVAPSRYMEKIEKDDHVSSENLNAYIETHAINPKTMRCDDFDAFFIERAKALISMIGDAMGKQVPNLSGEDVVEAFGSSLE